MHRVTLIGVFLGHFRINLHQTRTQYYNERPQATLERSQIFKNRCLNLDIFVAEKQLFSLFFAAFTASLQLCPKSINDVTDS